MIWLIIGVIAILLVLYMILTFNNLVQLKNRVYTQWTQIDVQLEHRFLISMNVLELVESYAQHEAQLLKNVKNIQNTFVSATAPVDKMKANKELTQALNKLNAVSESYPELKADSNFITLQNDLRETENQIAIAGGFYNELVLKYNDSVQKFPSNVIASLFNFKVEKIFEATKEELETEKVRIL